MAQRTDRRNFIKASTAVGVGFWVAGNLRAEDSATPTPNEKINFACVGVGGKGSSDTADAASHGNIVAICDVDDNTLLKAGEAYPDAKRYNDYRVMLDEMGDKIDAVTVSTPDHTHACVSAAAMKKGKHCFTQKPLTHTLYEARRLAEIAREMNVATQMGNQGTANATLRHAAALLRAGSVGAVKEVHVWTNRPIWPQGTKRPKDEAAPGHVHWDLWLGPAPLRAFSKSYHPFAWRGWWDFGTGALGDMACHTMNMPFMGLDLRDPISVESENSWHNHNSYPNWSIITYEFPSNDWRPGVKMVWYDGGKKVPQELLDGAELSDTGVLVIGEKDKMYCPGDYCENGHKFLGGSEEPEVEFPESPGHFAEWVRAIQGGDAAMSNFPDYAGPLSETVLLGNLAVFAGKKVDWDAKSLRATNAPEVDEVIQYEYRDGYTL